jgi:hypothetical protein
MGVCVEYLDVLYYLVAVLFPLLFGTEALRLDHGGDGRKYAESVGNGLGVIDVHTYCYEIQVFLSS